MDKAAPCAYVSHVTNRFWEVYMSPMKVSAKTGRYALLLFMLLSLLVLLFLGDIHAQQTAKDPLAGVWQGTLQPPQGGPWEVYFTLVKRADGAYSGKADIPAQQARNIPLNAVRFAAPDLTLDLSSYGIVFEGKLAPDLSSISGQLKLGELSLPLSLRRSAGVPELRRPQDPRKPYPYEETEVSFRVADAGISLAGALTIPSGQGPFPAVVLINGSGPQDRDSTLAGHRPFLILADYLTRKGIAVLRFDDRGGGKSTGDFHKATTADFASDARAAWEFLKQQPRIDSRKVGLLGHSEGAMIGSMVAAQSREVAFLVLLAGTGIPGEKLALLQTETISKSRGAGEEAIRKERRMYERLIEAMKGQPEETLAEQEMRQIIAEFLSQLSEAEKKELAVSEQSLIQEMKGYLADFPWNRFFLDYDPAVDLGKVACPVLALNGEKDTQVPAEINLRAIESALKRAGNTKVEIKKLPALNHLFQTAQSGHPREYGKIEETIAPAVLELIGQWISRQVRG